MKLKRLFKVKLQGVVSVGIEGKEIIVGMYGER